MLDSITELVGKFGDFLLTVLPTSPFREFINECSDLPFLNYLNWFIPVATIIKISKAWLAAIALFYVYSIVMRWVKVIGD